MAAVEIRTGCVPQERCTGGDSHQALEKVVRRTKGEGPKNRFPEKSLHLEGRMKMKH